MLLFVSLKGSHNGQKIAKTFVKIIEANSLQKKLGIFVTDNTSNLKKAKMIGNEFAEEVQNGQNDADATKKFLVEVMLTELIL